MTNIAQQAGAAAQGYQLSEENVNPSSLHVTVNGTEVPQDSADGWTYHSGTNSVVFHGAYIPNEGDSIVIGYNYLHFLEITGLVLGLNASSPIYVGDMVDFGAAATYEDGSGGLIPLSDLTLTSSNTSVVNIMNGAAYAVGAGSATITAVTENNISSSLPVLVDGYRPLALNQVMSGTHIPAGGEVIYSIDLNTSGHLMTTSLSSVDTYGYLYDTNMTAIASDDDSGVNTNFKIEADLNAGTYYLKVTGFGGREVPSFDLNTTFN
jgi:hypothetical protein